MKLIYNEELTKEIVEEYYRSFEDIDGKLEIKVFTKLIPTIGRGIGYHSASRVSFRLKGTMKMKDSELPVETEVSESDIEDAFTTMVGLSGRKVKRVSLSYDEASFRGVIVDAVAKRKVK